MKVFKITPLMVLVLILQLSLYSTDYIFTVLDGDLGSNFTANITLFCEDFMGIILKGVDSSKNFITVKVYKVRNQKKFLRIRYNHNYRDMGLNATCGCEDCIYSMTYLSIKVTSGKINVACNDHIVKSTHSAVKSEKNATDSEADIPLAYKGRTNIIYVMVGNSGQFTDDRGMEVYPHKIQMVGCLHKLTLNKTAVQFNNSVGHRVKPKCVKQCIPKDLCNAGTCMETYTHLRCICNHTALNGRHCNDSLKTYIQGTNNSYVTVKSEEHVHMKVTWQQSSPSDMFCLLELINGDSYNLIRVNKTDLIVNQNERFPLDVVAINFINVNITKDNSYFQIGNVRKNLQFSLREKTQINVGYSTINGKCRPLDGLYDVSFDQSQLRQLSVSTTPTSTVSTRTSTEMLEPTNSSLLLSNDTSTNKVTAGFSAINQADLFKNGIIIMVSVGMGIVCIILAMMFILRKTLNKSKSTITQLVEIEEDDLTIYNPEYQQYNSINGDGISISTYGGCYSSSDYYAAEMGPQLPPRDEGPQWIEISNDYRLSTSSSQCNSYYSLDEKKTYLCIEDDEYATVRQSSEFPSLTGPQLPPRDN